MSPMFGVQMQVGWHLLGKINKFGTRECIYIIRVVEKKDQNKNKS